jgi:hypothetical protein
MKRNEDLSVGGSIAVTIVFAILAVVTYQTDSNGNPLAWIPGIMVIVGIIMTIIAVNKASNDSAKDEQQKNAARTIKYDSTFGKGDFKLYFDSVTSKVTICATTTDGAKQEEITNFVRSKAVETDNYLVAVDSKNHKILKTKNNYGKISKSICNLDEELKALGVIIKESNLNLKAYNDYAFVTDDINEFVAIVTPSKIHVHRYSDIVSISYEENGSDVFNKSIGGAVVGGLLFGGVGAIVGGNTAKAKQNKEVRNMSIKILLKSTSDSTIILKIYEGAVLETKKDADRIYYEGLMKEVSGIKDIFSIIIDIVDKKKVSSPVNTTSSLSVADELEKLAKLKNAGILSEEEFKEQKAKLLSQ